MKKDNSKSFWPYGITLAILAVVIMGAGTIMIALKHPVQMDEAYLDKHYQEVDGHINEILESERLFSKQYKIILSNTKFKIGKNSLKVDIIDKYSHRHVDNMKVSVKITRPDSDEFDIKLKSKDGEDKGYLFPAFDINKHGRWIVLIKASNNKVEGFLKREIDVLGNS